MARSDFPLSMDRRRLLATGAAVVTGAIVPRAGCAKTALTNATKPATLPAETPALKLCAATARRLMEISCRNEIRRNLTSKIYPFSGTKDYGTTKHGAYMCERDTAASGMRAAKNETHP
jgi:hypothetical protein